VTGPRWVKKENYPFTAIPVFVRENTVLLLGPEDVTVPDYKFAEIGLEVRKYQVAADADFEVPVPSGEGSEWVGKIKVKGGEVQGEGVKIGSLSEMKVEKDL
jgi:hypothetical protein